MHKKLSLSQKIIAYMILTIVGIVLSIPFIFMISIAFSSDRTNTTMAFTIIPTEFHVSNLVTVFTDPRVPVWLFNSLKLVVVNMIGQVFISSLVAYGFARFRYKHSNKIFMVLLGTMMIPGQVCLIPQFIIFRELGWINTLLPLMVPAFFGGAYNIFLLRQFIMRIPTSLDDAAKIDGLGFFGIYTKIIFPLIRPAAIAVAIFTFNWAWGEFMGPLIYTSDAKKMPLALGVQLLSSVPGGASPKYNIILSAALILTIPLIFVYFFGQKFLYEMSISGGSESSK